MREKILTLTTTILILGFQICVSQEITFEINNLDLVNREVMSIDDPKGTLVLGSEKGPGLAKIKNASFEKGTIELELKGDTITGFFPGFAFNIQNDSTYEAIYFRPRNFRAADRIRREHSVQYISHPKYTWRYLRANNEGEFESDYPRKPASDEWLGVRLKIDDDRILVYDQRTGNELLSVERLTKQISDSIGLWTGNISTGKFRNLKIIK
ncbi:MAG: hypothetical protein AAGE93_12215 [Bacteroidota bacterium]